MNASFATRLDECTSPLDDGSEPPTSALNAEARSSVPSSWEPGTVIGHRYRINRVLEVGGTATVYEATQIDLIRRVAIKVPRDDSVVDPRRARRFEQEARTLAELQHPHIVSVFELGRSEEGVSFMAMEFVDGPALRAQLATAGPLHWRTAASVAIQLADALECAHASGVVHGDVSARNVLLVRRDETFDCKLIDFGAARKVGDRPQLAWGTRRYVAPELFSGEAPHVLSDLYALGALLKEMVGDALGASPAPLQALIDSMLSVEPLGRPQSAGEVALRLHDVLECQSAPLPDPTGVYADPADGPSYRVLASRAARHSRRRWQVGGLIAGLLLSALFLLYGYGNREAPSPFTGIVAAASVVPTAPVPTESSEVQPPAPAQPQLVLQPTPTLARNSAAASIVKRLQKNAPVAEVAASQSPESPPLDPVERQGEAAANRASSELASDESAARQSIVASLDEWIAERDQAGNGEGPSETSTRVGDPIIVFDPRGTSASVTYRAVVMYSNGDRGTHEIVKEQVFFAKAGEEWQLLD